MLWLLEFTREGHRYRAELRPEGGGRDPASGMAWGSWYVSMDGNPPRRAFEADVRDEDTEEFRRRVVAAAHTQEGAQLQARESPEVESPLQERDDETEEWPRHPH